MTISNWTNDKVRPYVYRGEVPKPDKAQQRYRLTEPGKVSSTITSSKTLEALQEKYPNATIKPL